MKESLEQAFFQLGWHSGPVVDYHQDAVAILGGSRDPNVIATMTQGVGNQIVDDLPDVKGVGVDLDAWHPDLQVFTRSDLRCRHRLYLLRKIDWSHLHGQRIGVEPSPGQ